MKLKLSDKQERVICSMRGGSIIQRMNGRYFDTDQYRHLMPSFIKDMVNLGLIEKTKGNVYEITELSKTIKL